MDQQTYLQCIRVNEFNSTTEDFTCCPGGCHEGARHDHEKDANCCSDGVHHPHRINNTRKYCTILVFWDANRLMLVLDYIEGIG